MNNPFIAIIGAAFELPRKEENIPVLALVLYAPELSLEVALPLSI